MKMELNEIQDLIKFVAKSGVSEVELESKGFKIIIKTNTSSKKGQDQPMYMQQAQPMQHVVHTPAAGIPAPQPVNHGAAGGAESKPGEKKDSAETSKYITIKSPMIGTFYRSPGPDKPLFVNVGDEIKPGKVTCIIEAMKLFNEIESEVSGRIVKVLVDDSTPVEYDQPLFLVDPS
jgi:acetyl-CoA carboxylase biotin carboxyl carrier protein